MSTPESQKVCQLCGYANTTKARFCRNCGNNLEKIPAQQSFTIPSSTEGPIMFSGLSKIKKRILCTYISYFIICYSFYRFSYFFSYIFIRAWSRSKY